MAKTFAELHAAGFGRWRLPTSRQCAVINDYIRQRKETVPPPDAKSYQLALWRIRLDNPAFLTQ